jgi:membrane associated rhomboid family serine protease
MFLLVPYHVDVPMRCWPWMNWVLIGLTIILYPLCVWGGDLTPLGRQLMLGGDSWIGFVGHVFVHADLLHLLGNMLFLWIFGNAICAKVGNLVYPFLYLGLGLGAGLVSYLIDPHPAIGASGAINGLVGMFLVWYLLNEIQVWYGYWWYSLGGHMGTFAVSSFWMVLLWLVFDIWGAIRGSGTIGYLAHLAGFGLGFLTAIVLLLLHWIEMDTGERSLLQLVFGHGEPAAKARKRVRKESPRPR